MSGLAAAIGGSTPRSKQLLKALLDAQTSLGPDACFAASVETASFGKRLLAALPEDRYDQQPFRSADGRWIVISEGRLGDRDELIERLGLGRDVPMSDAGLLALAWTRLGPSIGEVVPGDWTLCAWETERRRLTLARSPLGSLPMFYGTHEGVFMCASIPQALHRAGMPAILDVEYSAATFAMAEASLDETMFKGIRRLGPGEAITFSIDGAAISRSRIWHPDTQVQRAPSPERVFEIVEKAVTAALRRSRGLAATQLSAGRDSGLITTMAARHEPHLVAFTAAPSRGFFDSGLPHFLQDESELAGTVARWCGARHHVVRTVDDSPSFMETVRRFHATSARSVLNVRNVFWWDGIGRAASATGASILLTGSIGNLTVSAGGVNALGDVRREEGLGRWWPLAQKLALLPDVDWKTVANQSFPVLFPARVRRGLRKLARRPDRFSPGRNLFRQDFQERIAATRAEKGRYDQRFYHEERAQALEVVDLEERTLAAHYGLSVRDPTADLRVAKLFLGMPAIDLVSEKGGRPLFDRCFGPLFPPEWHDERRRGLQSADWMEQFRPNDLLETLEEIETSNLARELIDLPYAQQLLQRWVSVPTTPAEQLLYSGSLLEALAFGLFVKDHF